MQTLGQSADLLLPKPMVLSSKLNIAIVNDLVQLAKRLRYSLAPEL